jgi:hypothetical protein
VAGCIEDDGAGELDLPHGGLPPVAGVAVGVGERLRQQRQPALHENGDHTRPQTVTDLLQGWRVGAGGKTVGQLGETDAGVAGLAFGPLVAVDPDLGRVGKVGADLDERGTEVEVDGGSPMTTGGRPA